MDDTGSRCGMAELIWQSGQWDRMLARHMLWKEKYPDKPKDRGIAFTGIETELTRMTDLWQLVLGLLILALVVLLPRGLAGLSALAARRRA